jgi:SAM-dependent methyltransferase
MTTTSRHDAWAAGDSYDAYMGRWSRPIAARFLDWLAMPDSLDWLELGCGTGAMTAAIVRQCKPVSLIAIEPSEGFIAKARESVDSPRVEFIVGDAGRLASMPSASRDVAVAALVLNFIPDRLGVLREMKRIVRPGGTVGFYVWDYPGGGIAFMRAFWTAAVALDPAAGDLTVLHTREPCRIGPASRPRRYRRDRDRVSIRVPGFRRLLASFHTRGRARTGLLREPLARSPKGPKAKAIGWPPATRGRLYRARHKGLGFEGARVLTASAA